MTLVTGAYYLYHPTGCVTCLDQDLDEIPASGFGSVLSFITNTVTFLEPGGQEFEVPCLGAWAFNDRSEMNLWVALMRGGDAAEASRRLGARKVPPLCR